jgi:class 3 adenylate cyclase
MYNSILMEPRIQYAKTADGVSIAFWTLGEGTPHVEMPNLPYSHIQLEWQDPGHRLWYKPWAGKRKLVRYDGRGTGLSDRNVADYSVDAHMLDLEAVVERLGVQRFALLGPVNTAPVAVAYAARHPEAVSHLLLWCPWAWARGARSGAFRALLERDWELFTESLAYASGWSTGEEAHSFAAYLRECTTPEAARAILNALAEFDVITVLSQVRSPTLILQRREGLALPGGVESARRLASGIPDARLVLLEGASLMPWVGDMEAVLAAIDEFLEDSEPAAARAEPVSAGGFCTILFTDVEGSTALTQRLGDAKAREVLRNHERIVREALRAHGGAEVKAMGDAFMASFSSATRALKCAVAIQRAFAAHNETAVEPTRVRIGLNAGEPIAEDEDLFGAAVILAARIAAQAKGGEILASNVVRELVAGKGFLFADRGEVALKGFVDPMRLYDVQWQPPLNEPRGSDSNSL